jgi:hypothetical protein
MDFGEFFFEIQLDLLAESQNSAFIWSSNLLAVDPTVFWIMQLGSSFLQLVSGVESSIFILIIGSKITVLEPVFRVAGGLRADLQCQTVAGWVPGA